MSRFSIFRKIILELIMINTELALILVPGTHPAPRTQLGTDQGLN